MVCRLNKITTGWYLNLDRLRSFALFFEKLKVLPCSVVHFKVVPQRTIGTAILPILSGALLGRSPDCATKALPDSM